MHLPILQTRLILGLNIYERYHFFNLYSIQFIQPSQPKPFEGVVRVKTEPKNGGVQIDTVNVSTESEAKSQDEVHKELTKQVLELKSKNDDMFFELQKTKESLNLARKDNGTLKSKNHQMEQELKSNALQLEKLVNELDDIKANNKLLKTENQHLDALYKELQAGINQNQNDVEQDETSGSYEVEQILDHKKKRKVIMYLVRWAGYDPSHDSWVPENGMNCTEILSNYKTSHNLN